MFINKTCYFLFIFLFLFLLEGSGQNSLGKALQQETAISFYRKSVDGNSKLYKGKVYVGVNQLIKGHQFVGSDEWQNGKILFDGNLYQDVPMLYDIWKEELIIQHINGFLKIQMLKSEVNFFYFSDYSFLHIRENDSTETLIPAGYYDEIYHGELSVLVKRKKIIKETIEQMEVKREFEQINHYYIKKEGAYHLVRSKGSVLRVLNDHKKEVRRNVRANKIKFRKDPEHAIVKMVQFYEQAIH